MSVKVIQKESLEEKQKEIWDNYFQSNSRALGLRKETNENLEKTFAEGPPFSREFYREAENDAMTQICNASTYMDSLFENFTQAAIYKKRSGGKGLLPEFVFEKFREFAVNDKRWEAIKSKTQ